ncbi:hypothetical protein A2U01_0067249 [Trifolium medium]|uniref:Uncharacterized protein n=1 Tax=Trifolium medium TaxID=97028 RepID=A0A392SBG9_9FABA|nr:hypothetical protein [Trifolium medium]
MTKVYRKVPWSLVEKIRGGEMEGRVTKKMNSVRQDRNREQPNSNDRIKNNHRRSRGGELEISEQKKNNH